MRILTFCRSTCDVQMNSDLDLRIGFLLHRESFWWGVPLLPFYGLSVGFDYLSVVSCATTRRTYLETLLETDFRDWFEIGSGCRQGDCQAVGLPRDGNARGSVESNDSRVTPLYDAFLGLTTAFLDGASVSNSLMSAGICLYPVMRRNCFCATRSPDPTQRSR